MTVCLSIKTTRGDLISIMLFFSVCHRMTGNLSLWTSTPAHPLQNVSFFSLLNPSAPPSPPSWEAPSFTVVAHCCVPATLMLFVFAAVSNLLVLISVCWGQGYRLAAHLHLLIASLASADLVMTFVVMPLDASWNITVHWYAGDVMCKLLCFLKLFAMHSAAFILVVVSLKRYQAILHPPSWTLSMLGSGTDACCLWSGL